MKYISVCSGIEAATVAWHSLGWEPIAFSEIEPFPCTVLAHHWPHVPNLGDMTNHANWPTHLKPDLIIGGTPCQAFSVSGLRKGLADPRGNLTLTFLSVIAQYSPRWVVWENVPGVLSDKTRAFGAFLGGLAELGYGFAYRVLDAQYYGVAQRRRRVFVVGYLGDWRRAAAVLFERQSLSGDSPPRRDQREGASTGIKASTVVSDEPIFLDRAAFNQGKNAQFLPAIRADGLNDALVARGHHAVCMATGQANAEIATEICPTLNCNHEAPIVTTQLIGSIDHEYNGHTAEKPTGQLLKGSPTGGGKPLPAVAYCIAENIIGRQDHNGGNGQGFQNELSYTLNTVSPPDVAFSEGYFRCGSGHAPQSDITNTLQCNTGDQRISVATSYTVRRLTPTECERLQGFPDHHTAIAYKQKPAKDAPRYKALGNSMAVPVIHWLGERINLIHTITP